MSVVHLLYGSVRRRLGEDEATVLRGLLVALDREGDGEDGGESVDIARAVVVIDEERRRSGVPSLPEARVRELLDDLTRSRVVRREGENGQRLALREHVVRASDQAQGWTAADRLFE